jgi:hypothetical protein
VIILLAQVIPAGKLPKYSYIPELNATLARLAAKLHTPAQPVIIVDQAAVWQRGRFPAGQFGDHLGERHAPLDGFGIDAISDDWRERNRSADSAIH